jgi:hypothetical protein
MPFLNFGSTQPFVLLSRPCNQRAFVGIWPDWYRSQGSEFYGAESIGTNVGRIQGGILYHPRTDGTRNPVFERLFLTVSPRIEEVLPTVPNPVGLHAHEAVDRLWQESWGPENFAKQMERSKMLRSYGIEKLIQCNHEISWRDGGESFTLRRNAAPAKGGDQALKEYVAHQRSLDWMAGLYSNYTDYSPVNEFWTPDGVQRGPDGNWRSAWPRCWRLKPLKAVEFDKVLAPYIKRTFNPNSAYTDVHTAVAPWVYNDYDIRMPGAGTMAQTFYAYGELLRNDSMVYGGPIFSEGSYHWMYAGLADGNYAIAYNGRPMAKEPLLPVFDLFQIHTKECDIGMGWTAFFCDAIPNWKAPENVDKAIDRFLLNTLAYGHIGWLVEEEHGINRTCRSYYMLQAVQAQYGLKSPVRIAYWDGSQLQDLSAAVDQDLPRSRRQLYIEYPGKLELWLNDHTNENWSITLGGKTVDLPPAGWAAYKASTGLISHSSLINGSKADYLKCSSYVFQDGRGKRLATSEAESSGGLAIMPVQKDRLRIIHISGEGMFMIKRPFKTGGKLAKAAAFNTEGRNLGSPRWIDENEITQIEPIKGAVRYELEFQRVK